MIRLCKYFIFLCFLLASTSIFATDTLFIDKIQSKINLYQQISILEDTNSTLTIDDLIKQKGQYSFAPNSKNKLNFGFSKSTFWFHLIIKNKTTKPIDYILEVSNADLDHISFYQVSNDVVVRKIETGELHSIKTRAYLHRNFLFPIKLDPGNTGEYFMNVNNLGHSLTVPLLLIEESFHQKADSKNEIFSWLIYGLLAFIILFNIYLYYSSRDKVNLLNSLVILFASITQLIYDGYFYLFNFPNIVEKLKWIYPGLYTYFLIIFTLEFIKNEDKSKGIKRFSTFFKVIAIILPFFYFFPSPVSLVADIGLPLLILFSQIFLITIAFIYLDKNYAPSLFLIAAFCSVFLGMLIHEMKEMNIVNLNFFVLNSMKIGLTVECILLTIAVLERFRINLEQARKTIEISYNKIEAQNKELEIINSELEKLSIVASETNNSVAIYDPEGKIEWCNAHFEKFYRTTLSALIKSKHDSITDIVPNKMIRELFKRCLSDKKSITFETHVRSDESCEIWAQTTLTPLIRNRKVYKMIAIDSDITKLKQYEKNLIMAKEKAIESDRLKTVFLGNMSHEIRTPMNGILGFSDLLLNTDTDEEKRARYLKIIASNGEQLLRIIDDIIDISLIESNQLKIHPAPFNLTHLIDEIVDLFKVLRDSIGKTNIDLNIEYNIKPKESIIISDAIRIKQVLNNLLRNALKFTKEGYVKLVCKKEDSFIYFYVEDTGIGISPEKQNIIFERFRQADERVSREFGGTGLGLAISKGIVEKMGGRIWVDDNYSQGLRICFSIKNHEPGYVEVDENEIAQQNKSLPDIKLN